MKIITLMMMILIIPYHPYHYRYDQLFFTAPSWLTQSTSDPRFQIIWGYGGQYLQQVYIDLQEIHNSKIISTISGEQRKTPNFCGPEQVYIIQQIVAYIPRLHCEIRKPWMFGTRIIAEPRDEFQTPTWAQLCLVSASWTHG